MNKIFLMRSKQLLLIFIALSGLVACSSGDHKFTIIGSVTGMPEQTVILEQLNANDIITIVDSERTKPDGHFELSGVAPEPGLYRIHFRHNKFILLSVDKGNIKITSDWKTLENYTVSGSVPSEHLKNFVVSIRGHLRDFNTMSIVMDTLKTRGNDSILDAAKKNFQDMGVQFTQFVEKYADTTPYEPGAVFAARMLNPMTENNFLESFAQSLNRRFPGTRMTRDYLEYYMKESSKQKMPANSGPVGLGATAPELVLTSVDGGPISLSSFKGKYVLLDFWASWCAPCRAENPFIVDAYNKYKDKNFTIYGVSLDNNKDAWERAIKDDHITWTQVSDLKGWSSAAAMIYGVQSIPTNFLIDPKGKIIAQSLRGEQLDEMLKNVLKAQTP